MKNYYKILGVIPTAEMIIIKAAYRALSQKYHPDKNRDEAEKYQQKRERMKRCLQNKLLSRSLLLKLSF
jgi:DnaJ-class molecular chaperone